MIAAGRCIFSAMPTYSDARPDRRRLDCSDRGDDLDTSLALSAGEIRETQVTAASLEALNPGLPIAPWSKTWMAVMRTVMTGQARPSLHPVAPGLRAGHPRLACLAQPLRTDRARAKPSCGLLFFEGHVARIERSEMRGRCAPRRPRISLRSNQATLADEEIAAWQEGLKWRNLHIPTRLGGRYRCNVKVVTKVGIYGAGSNKYSIIFPRGGAYGDIHFTRN